MRIFLIGVALLAIAVPAAAANGIVSFTGGIQFIGFSSGKPLAGSSLWPLPSR